MFKIRLGRQGLQLVESVTQAELEVCNTEKVSEMLNNKFKLQYNETIKSLQFHKLMRQVNENTDELKGRIRVVAIECNYKDLDRQLSKHFIHGLNDSVKLAEIIRELTETDEIHW